MKKILYFLFVFFMCGYSSINAQSLSGTSWYANQTFLASVGTAGGFTLDSVIMYFNAPDDFRLQAYTPDSSFGTKGIWWESGSVVRFVDTQNTFHFNMPCAVDDTSMHIFAIAPGGIADTLTLSGSTDQCSYRGALLVGQWYGPAKTTSVSNVTATGNSFTVYPNPITDVINIQFAVNLSSSVKAVLYDMQGRACKAMTLFGDGNKMTISGIGNLPAGIYTLQLSSASTTDHFNILKQ